MTIDSYLQCACRLSTTTILTWCQILPEQTVIQVSTSMEVDDWLHCDSSGDISLGFSGLDLFACSIEAVDIGLVMVLVVKLHDFTGDSRFKRAIIVCHGN